MIYMYHKDQITSLPDAVLVSFYRCLICGRGAKGSIRGMIETCEAEIAARGIDLDTFCGATGFTTEKPT